MVAKDPYEDYRRIRDGQYREQLEALAASRIVWTWDEVREMLWLRYLYANRDPRSL